MLDDRKTAILRAVVEEYIATAQPVGSSHIAASDGVQVSSATVRNDMAFLEQEGYLAQPHTSAGRIPTDKGYRFFVDHLTPNGKLGVADQMKVGEFFDTATGRLEETLQRTSTLLAQMTNYAAVVLGPKKEVAVVRSVQLVGLSAHLATAVVVLSNGTVESEPIELATTISEDELHRTSAHLSRLMVGKALGDIAHFAATGDVVLDTLAKQVLAAMSGRRTDESVFVGGASAMAEAFDAVEIVRSVLHTLEQQFVMVSLVRDMLNRGLSVAIGAEHGVEPLAACSVVLAPVIADGTTFGTVGILGPTRMNYPQALATVEVVSDRLGRRLTDS
ncbi:heat-inducible transcription repressor HrcA [Actinomycetes bacterium]|nr:heat-inducible transcription repressor HrcA [Actinomycetes bacterium]